jgi:hypothetical protein
MVRDSVQRNFLHMTLILLLLLLATCYLRAWKSPSFLFSILVPKLPNMRYFHTTAIFGLLGFCACAQQVVSNPAVACQKLGASLAIENVTVNFAEYLPAGTNISLTQAYNLSTCGYTSQFVTNDLCRLAMYVATSHRSGQ